MPRLDSLKYCFWRNRHAPEPVLVGTVFVDDAFDWTAQRLSPVVLADARLLGADGLMARLAQIQRLGDMTGSASGVFSRDDAKKTSVLFFSFQDTYLAPRSLSLTVQVVERLTYPDIGPERLARMLESSAGIVEAHGFERMTREIISAAAQRGIPSTYEEPARLIANEAADGDFVVAFASDSYSIIEYCHAALRATRSPA